MIETLELSKIFRKPVEADGDNNGKKKKAWKIKKTPKDFYAVDHVSFTANDGEILGVLGPNGAGKTTLLRMMGCLMQPESGSVKITLPGQDGTVSDTNTIKRNIGYLSGNTKLYGRFTPREIMRILGKVYGLSEDVISERIDDIVKVLHMEDFIDNKISLLSTGQTQKINIARCLVHNPSIYIFDEPTLGLDILSSESIIEFMKQEKEKGKTILYSTHYMEEAQYLCDRIVFMHYGKLIDEGTPEELMNKYSCNNLRDTFKACITSKEN